MDKQIKIEVLFPEIANLYGDLGNIEYITKSYPEIEIHETHLVDEPLFLTEVPDLIYMGTMTESAQKLVINKLSQYKDRLIELIESGARFLITGNALEVFGYQIRDKEGEVIDGLNIMPFFAKRDMLRRFNSLYLGKFNCEDDKNFNDDEFITIVGYKSQFTHGYRTNEGNPTFADENVGYMFHSDRGPGLNPDIKEEGLWYKNFLGTYLLGPLLVLNPLFTRWLLKELGIAEPKLIYEEHAMNAYNVRVDEYSNPKTGFYY